MIKIVWKCINTIAISHKRGMEQAEIIDTFWTYQALGARRGAHEAGGASYREGAPHPRGRHVSPTSWFSSLPCVFCSKDISPEGFIPFGLRLIFLFCKTLKQAKKTAIWTGPLG